MPNSEEIGGVTRPPGMLLNLTTFRIRQVPLPPPRAPLQLQ